MTSDHPEPWLDELLSDHELDELRAATLDQGLAMVRRRRQWRRMRRVTGAIVCLAGVATVALMVLFESASPGRDKLLTSADLHLPAAASSAEDVSDNTGPGDVGRLSDDELLALFPNRPVALIGPVGRQKLVFLDQFRAGSSP